jgi:hypothetical protein
MRPTVTIITAFLALTCGAARGGAQTPQAPDSTRALLLVPKAVWDGTADAPQEGWVVLVRGGKIEATGPEARLTVPAGAERIPLAGTTLLPGLIEGHSHLFLHPYDETLWDDQVLKEPLGLRIARAVAHAGATLRAGITTERDLGTEGALDNDVQLRRAIEQKIVPGPRLIVVTRAIVATGSYGPSRSHYAFDPPQGAEEADGDDAITRVVRSQVGRGADWIKVYADYPWGPGGELRPTFSQHELEVLDARWRPMPCRRRACAGPYSRGWKPSSTAITALPRCSASCASAGWRCVPRSPQGRPTRPISTDG